MSVTPKYCTLQCLFFKCFATCGGQSITHADTEREWHLLAKKKDPAGVSQRGINGDFRASALPPSCYPSKAEQACAEEDDGGGFGDGGDIETESVLR